MSEITLLQEYDKPIFLENGSEGFIYRISDKYVVKVPARNRYKLQMEHEINISRLLFSHKISVPEPITIDYVNVRDKVERGFIMEYICGESWDDEGIDEEDIILGRKLAKLQIEKSIEKGFFYNHAVNPQWILTYDGKLKLIDFTNWKYKRL